MRSSAMLELRCVASAEGRCERGRAIRLLMFFCGRAVIFYHGEGSERDERAITDLRRSVLSGGRCTVTSMSALQGYSWQKSWTHEMASFHNEETGCAELGVVLAPSCRSIVQHESE